MADSPGFAAARGGALPAPAPAPAPVLAPAPAAAVKRTNSVTGVLARFLARAHTPASPPLRRVVRAPQPVARPQITTTTTSAADSEDEDGGSAPALVSPFAGGSTAGDTLSARLGLLPPVPVARRTVPPPMPPLLNQLGSQTAAPAGAETAAVEEKEGEEKRMVETRVPSGDAVGRRGSSGGQLLAAVADAEEEAAGAEGEFRSAAATYQSAWREQLKLELVEQYRATHSPPRVPMLRVASLLSGQARIRHTTWGVTLRTLAAAVPPLVDAHAAYLAAAASWAASAGMDASAGLSHPPAPPPPISNDVPATLAAPLAGAAHDMYAAAAGLLARCGLNDANGGLPDLAWVAGGAVTLAYDMQFAHDMTGAAEATAEWLTAALTLLRAAVATVGAEVAALGVAIAGAPASSRARVRSHARIAIACAAADVAALAGRWQRHATVLTRAAEAHTAATLAMTDFVHAALIGDEAVLAAEVEGGVVAATADGLAHRKAVVSSRAASNAVYQKDLARRFADAFARRYAAATTSPRDGGGGRCIASIAYDALSRSVPCATGGAASSPPRASRAATTAAAAAAAASRTPPPLLTVLAALRSTRRSSVELPAGHGDHHQMVADLAVPYDLPAASDAATAAHDPTTRYVHDLFASAASPSYPGVKQVACMLCPCAECTAHIAATLEHAAARPGDSSGRAQRCIVELPPLVPVEEAAPAPTSGDAAAPATSAAAPPPRGKHFAYSTAVGADGGLECGIHELPIPCRDAAPGLHRHSVALSGMRALLLTDPVLAGLAAMRWTTSAPPLPLFKLLLAALVAGGVDVASGGDGGGVAQAVADAQAAATEAATCASWASPPGAVLQAAFAEDEMWADGVALTRAHRIVPRLTPALAAAARYVTAALRGAERETEWEGDSRDTVAYAAEVGTAWRDVTRALTPAAITRIVNANVLQGGVAYHVLVAAASAALRGATPTHPAAIPPELARAWARRPAADVVAAFATQDAVVHLLGDIDAAALPVASISAAALYAWLSAAHAARAALLPFIAAMTRHAFGTVPPALSSPPSATSPLPPAGAKALEPPAATHGGVSGGSGGGGDAGKGADDDDGSGIMAPVSVGMGTPLTTGMIHVPVRGSAPTPHRVALRKPAHTFYHVNDARRLPHLVAGASTHVLPTSPRSKAFAPPPAPPSHAAHVDDFGSNGSIMKAALRALSFRGSSTLSGAGGAAASSDEEEPSRVTPRSPPPPAVVNTDGTSPGRRVSPITTASRAASAVAARIAASRAAPSVLDDLEAQEAVAEPEFPVPLASRFTTATAIASAGTPVMHQLQQSGWRGRFGLRSGGGDGSDSDDDDDAARRRAAAVSPVHPPRGPPPQPSPGRVPAPSDTAYRAAARAAGTLALARAAVGRSPPPPAADASTATLPSRGAGAPAAAATVRGSPLPHSGAVHAPPTVTAHGPRTLPVASPVLAAALAASEASLPRSRSQRLARAYAAGLAAASPVAAATAAALAVAAASPSSRSVAGAPAAGQHHRGTAFAAHS